MYDQTTADYHVKALEAVLDDFRTWLFRGQDAQYVAATFDDLRDQLVEIQQEQDRRRTMMNLTRVGPYLIALDSFEAALSTFVPADKVTVLMAYVWGPLRWLARTASADDHAFDQLLDLVQTLGADLTLLNEMDSDQWLSPHSAVLLVDLYHDILEMVKAVLCLFRRPSWQKMFRSSWCSLAPKFTTLSRCASMQTALAESLALQGESSPTQTSTKVREYTSQRKALLADAEREANAREAEQRACVIRWISAPTQNAALHEKHRRDRLASPDSGKWLLDHPIIRDWIDGDDNTCPRVWLDGESGTGKSVLASTLIDHCDTLAQRTRADSEVYYFHCAGSLSPQHDTALGLAKALAAQLLERQPDLLPVVVELAKTSGEVTLSSVDKARELLLLGLEIERRQYFVIDGLDTCRPSGRARALLSAFSQIMRDKSLAAGASRPRVLLAGRLTPEMRSLAGDVAVVPVRPEDTADDIGRYARANMLDVRARLPSVSPVDAEYIQRKVVQQSRGNFLRARLTIELFLLQESKEDLLRAVSFTTSAASVDEIYTKIGEQIFEGLRHRSNGLVVIANTLLSWFGSAQRVLTWHEMESICRLHWAPESAGPSSESVLSEILEAYHPVLRARPHETEGIQWLHSSAPGPITGAHQQDKHAAHFNLTVFCLSYLSGPTFSSDCSDETRDKEARRGTLVLQDYAAAHWADHVEVLLAHHDAVFRQQHYAAAFGNVLKAFISTHEEALRSTTRDPDATLRCSSYTSYAFHADLLAVYSLIRHQQQGTPAAVEQPVPVALPSLTLSLGLNRSAIERLASCSATPADRTLVAALYGSNVFRCSHQSCPASTVGFSSEAERAAHHNCHDRPFPCPLDGCTQAPFGFTSRKDKERHVRHYHPEHSDQPPAFVQPTRRIEDARFACEICGKAFTRNINLKGHMRSHFGDRPYACSLCGKAFTRLNDCRRHEKIHEKKG